VFEGGVTILSGSLKVAEGAAVANLTGVSVVGAFIGAGKMISGTAEATGGGVTAGVGLIELASGFSASGEGKGFFKREDVEKTLAWTRYTRLSGVMGKASEALALRSGLNQNEAKAFGNTVEWTMDISSDLRGFFNPERKLDRLSNFLSGISDTIGWASETVPLTPSYRRESIESGTNKARGKPQDIPDEITLTIERSRSDPNYGRPE
jgi:hypothetical protein